jgi:hypothetical protein
MKNSAVGWANISGGGVSGTTSLPAASNGCGRKILIKSKTLFEIIEKEEKSSVLPEHPPGRIEGKGV